MLARSFLAGRPKLRPYGVAVITSAYLCLAIAAIVLILHERPVRGELPENLAPVLRTVHTQYVGTISALAVHTTLFNEKSARHAIDEYARLLAATRAFEESLGATSVAAPLAGRLADPLREIALAAPVIERIGAGLIDASQGFTSLYGLEQDLRDLAAELDAVHERERNALAIAERRFAIRLVGLLVGLLVFSGLIVAMIWRDHARLKASYAQLAANSRALRLAKGRVEKASEAKSRFVATLSHEVRTPLNGVIGLSQLLQDEPMNPRARQFADAIYNSAVSLLEIINGVLDAGAVEAGTLRISRRAFSLDELLRTACAPFAAVARQKGIALETSIADDVQADRFLGDDLRLRQVLQNLIGNAVKFTEHGSIGVNVCSAGPSQLRFSVADTGIGIPEDQLPLIFERYHQVQSTATHAHGGTGLGLAICRELAGMMGGTITVSSKPGAGSIFTMTVPLSTVPEETEVVPLLESA